MQRNCYGWQKQNVNFARTASVIPDTQRPSRYSKHGEITRGKMFFLIDQQAENAMQCCILYKSTTLGCLQGDIENVRVA